jgi:antitoxin HicB
MRSGEESCWSETRRIATNKYSLLLELDLKEGGFTVTVPALPGCVTEGDTVEDALENAQDAIRSLLAYLKEAGKPIPEESAAPQLFAVEV